VSLPRRSNLFQGQSRLVMVSPNPSPPGEPWYGSQIHCITSLTLGFERPRHPRHRSVFPCRGKGCARRGAVLAKTSLPTVAHATERPASRQAAPHPHGKRVRSGEQRPIVVNQFLTSRSPSAHSAVRYQQLRKIESHIAQFARAGYNSPKMQ
jgi:hypothetical protein